jgi:hypothetical protein
MKINIPNAAPVDAATKDKMRKEGEIKKNQNFEKITGIFAEPSALDEQSKKQPKVFEYQINQQSKSQLLHASETA